MLRNRILAFLIGAIFILFMIFQLSGNERIADLSLSFIVPIFTTLYLLNEKNPRPFFTLFLVAYSLGDLITVFNLDFILDVEYYLGNSLYIIAYISLTLEILRNINFKSILRNFKMHIVVLIILNVYFNYFLLGIGRQYTTEHEQVMEMVYNIFTMLLVSASLLNYFYRADKKSLIIFLGSLCITVSEVLQIAYYYLSDNSMLKYCYSLLMLFAFYFYYHQSGFDYEEYYIVDSKKIRKEDYSY